MALPLGILMGAFTPIHHLFEPIMAPLRYMPISAFIPLLILWFGIYESEKIAFLFLGVFVYLLPVVVSAIRAVPEELVQTALTLGRVELQVIRTVLASGRASGDLRLVPRHERDLLDVRDSRRGGESGAWTRLHGRAGAHAPEGVVVVRGIVRHRRHRPHHRSAHPHGVDAPLPLAGDELERRDAAKINAASRRAGHRRRHCRRQKGAPPRRTAATGETPKLRIKDLGVTYIDRHGRSTEAVREVSLDILDKPGIGEIVVFLGPSGCGKSTILKSVAGLLPPTRGEVLVEGAAVTGVGRDRGMVFQAYTSFGWLTVRENVETEQYVTELSPRSSRTVSQPNDVYAWKTMPRSRPTPVDRFALRRRPRRASAAGARRRT